MATSSPRGIGRLRRVLHRVHHGVPAAVLLAATVATACARTEARPSPTTVERWPSGSFAEVAAEVDRFVGERGLRGASLVVVERSAGAVWEHHVGVGDPDRVSLVASASKSITAAVLVRLEDEGTLDLDVPVSELVEWADGRPGVTVAQMLSNSSGLVGLRDGSLDSPYPCQFLPAGTLVDFARVIATTTDDAAEVIPPDQAFRYGGGQWQLAGGVAEAVTGR